METKCKNIGLRFSVGRLSVLNRYRRGCPSMVVIESDGNLISVPAFEDNGKGIGAEQLDSNLSAGYVSVALDKAVPAGGAAAEQVVIAGCKCQQDFVGNTADLGAMCVKHGSCLPVGTADPIGRFGRRNCAGT